MTNNLKCILCSGTAVHHIVYTNLLQNDSWNGLYCTKCFVKKLRGMALVHKKRLVEAIAT